MMPRLVLLCALALLAACGGARQPAPHPVSTVAEPLDPGPPDPSIVPLTREQEDQVAR